MKQNYFLFSLALFATAASAQDSDIVTLDLTKASTTLTFNSTNGMWDGTYNDDEETIASQCFSFIHSSMGDYNTWWGFTASNSADNSFRSNTLLYQFSNMAKGGIVLDDNGNVKKDSFGAPVVSENIPYLVAFYSPYFAKRPLQMVFNDGKAHEAVGVYVNLNSYTYYSVTDGDGFCRAFTNGDSFTLTVNGVAEDESIRQVEVSLASYSNGDLTTSRGWKYVDLSSLGAVNELFFTLKSTDSGAYGDNTPAYFCMDKLMVKAAAGGGAANAYSDRDTLSYDRDTKTVLSSGEFTAVYNITGQLVRSSEDRAFSIADLDAGVYIIKSGNSRIKIAR